MLQDSQISEVQELLNFKCVKPLKTVYSVLSQASCLQIFDDELIVAATNEIIASPGKSRYTIQSEIKQKERAIEILSRRYAKPDINSDLIKQCLYSIGDNHAFWSNDW